jgi:RNA:NAD 2'-phosphotransferase (TPT1/KptA family)
MSQDHLKKVILIAIDLLNGDSLKKNEAGFCSIDELCERIKSTDKELSYINRNHVVELFFKDKDRKIFITGYDDIKYKEIRYVQPPDTLYFGTLRKLVNKMKQFGIKSSTKGYLKLYGTPELAADFARKFISSPEDKVAVLSIDSIGAFSSGMKFSTFKPNEFIVVRIDHKFIKGEV